MMTVEVELKFIATPDAIAALPALLARWPHQHHAAKNITNIYYETIDQQLRQQDMGLRIRGYSAVGASPTHYEMTLKTAGQVVGGLHQRPEYNVPLTTTALDVARFPAEVWPIEWDIAALQQALQPLFRTDFIRETWLITVQQSQIELALDRGEIATGEHSEPLCEIELELIAGEVADVLLLAEALADLGGLRQGDQSKAARGYHLAKGNPPRQCRRLPTLSTVAKATLEQGLQASLTMALEHWQYHEELWATGHSQAREPLIEAVTLIRQILVLFGGIIPRNATTSIRHFLNELSPQLTAEDTDAALLYRADYLHGKLALTHWLIQRGWQQAIDEKGQQKLAGSFKRFSDIMLSRCAADLKEAFRQPLNLTQYQEQLPRLTRQLLALQLLAWAYPSAPIAAYLQGWEVLQQHILHQHTHEAETARKQVLSQRPFWLHSAG